MAELALNTFNYKEYDTTNLHGKRIYVCGDNKFYPSITTVLGNSLPQEKSKSLEEWKARVGSKKADEITKAACDRGTNTHLMLERYLRNEDPKIEEFPENHVKVFKSLRLELNKVNKIYGQEVVLYSDVFGIAGRCDLVAEYKNEISIVDYKTSSRIKSKEEIEDYWLQTCFYAIAHNEMFGTDINKLVIMMGVENHLPMIFKKTIDENLITKLAERTCKFYEKL